MKRALVLTLGIYLLSPLLAYAGPVSWTGGGKSDTSWFNPNNWSSNPLLPGPSDDVTIGSFTVTDNGGAAALAKTVTCTGNLSLAGELSITSTSSFTTLTLMTGGALAAGGNATITGPLTMSGGSIGSGPGNVTISGVTMVTASSVLGGSGTITNSGTITIMGAGTQLSLGSSFVNQGTISIQSDGVSAGMVSAGTITNNSSGTIAKTTGTLSILTANVLTNSGTISAGAGTLQVWGGNGNENGTFSAASGATLEFPPGNFSNLTLTSGAVISGGGTVHLTGGILTVAANVTVSVATLQLDAGNSSVFLGDGNLTMTGSSMIWNSGTISLDHVGTATLIISPSTVLQILTTGNHDLIRNMDLRGTLMMSGDLFLAGSTLTIDTGATFNILTDNGISGSGTVSDGGTFEKTGGTGGTGSLLSFSGAFNITNNLGNRGAVDVTSGILNFAVAGTSSIDGAWMNNSTLIFSSGTYDVGVTGGLNTFSLTGQGSSELTGATWNVQETCSVTTNTFQLTAGVLMGVGDLTVNTPGGFIWSGGNMQGPSPGATTIPAGTTVTVSNSVSIGNRTINNSGTVTLSTSTTVLTLAGVTWNNDPGSFLTFAADANIADGTGLTSVFFNDGTVQKSGGTLTGSSMSFNGTFNNDLHGKVVVNVGSSVLTMGPTAGTSSGSWSAVNAGDTLSFADPLVLSNWTINTGTMITGKGTWQMVGAQWTLTANLDVKIATSKLSLPSSVIGAFDLTLESQIIRFDGFSRSGGTIKVPNQASRVGFTNPTSSLVLNNSTFDNSSQAAQFLGPVILQNSAQFLNEAVGKLTFDISGANALSDLSGDSTSTITNLGTITTANRIPQGITTAGVFVNNGTVTVPAGQTLKVAMGTGTSTGTHTANGTLTFSAGVYTLSTGTVLNGSGTINLGGTWRVTTEVTVASNVFQLGPQFSSLGMGGLVTGSTNFNLASPTVICRGGAFQIAPPAVITVPPGSALTSSTLACSLLGSTVNVDGKMAATQGSYSLGGANLNIDPGGTLQLGDSFAFTDAAGGVNKVINQGTTQKASGTGTFTFNYNGTFTNQGGTVNVASGTVTFDGSFAVPYTSISGATLVSKGAILSDSGSFTVNGGSLGGIGTIDGPVTINNGTLAPGGTSNGILSLTSPTTLNSGSTTTATISGTTPSRSNAPGSFDQINSTSSMALGGTLSLSFGAGFSPTAGQSFNILNFASSTGSYSSVVTPSPTCTAQLTTTATAINVAFTSSNVSVAINPTAVTLKVNQQQQFTDTVTNGCGNGVTWRVKEGAAGGTVTQSGLYTAPATPGTFHLLVTSVADNTKRAIATITVTTAGANEIAVTPQAAVIQPGGTMHLQANTTVNWTVAEGVSGGSVSPAGTYSAPSKPGLYHVVATGAADATHHAVANIAVVNGKLKSAYVASLDQNWVSVMAGVRSKGLATGQLQEMQTVSAGQLPSALAISPDNKYLLSTNHDSNDLSLFEVSPDSTLRIVPDTSIDTGTHPSAIAFDSAGRMAFVANHDSDDVSVFSLNAASGQMVQLGKQALAAGDQPSAIAVHPTASLVFVANSGSDTVAAFSYDSAGLLASISGSPLATGSKPSAAVIDVAGKFLLVANRGSGDVSVFAIDSKNKTLQEVSGSPYTSSQGAGALALDVTGTYLFVAGHEANDVTVFQIDGETGALTLLGHDALSTKGPSALAVDPSGQYVYVTSDRTNVSTTLPLNVATGQLGPALKSTMKGKASAIVLLGSSPGTTTQ